MDINLQGAVILPQSLPVVPQSADQPGVQKTDQKSGDASVAQRLAAADKVPAVSTEQKRFEAVHAAAQSFFKDVYAVSDTEFTIFKDASGQYITRYTSLRDGRVTYVPEPNMLQYMESRQQNRDALLAIQA